MLKHPSDRRGMSDVYIEYRVGDRELPCGTPLFILNGIPVWLLMEMLAVLFTQNELRSFVIISGNCICMVLYLNPSCHTLSKTLATSLRTMEHWCFSANAWAIFSYVMAMAVSVLRSSEAVL